MESNLKCLRSHTLIGQLPDFRQPTAITWGATIQTTFLHVKKSGFRKIIISYQSAVYLNMNLHIIIVLVF